jgi:hypothetical protein
MSRPPRILATLAIAATGVIALAGPVTAHVVQTVGTDTVALGWQHEPAYVNELNAVQVLVTDVSGAPIGDLAPGDLGVTVTFGGRTSEPVPLDPTWDEDTGLGTKGEYIAAIIPTEPGDYTFHLTGTIHGQAVDETATSGDSTFDSVTESTSIQFPDRLPSISQLVTRLGRLEARIDAAGPAPAPAASPTTAP